MLQPQFPYKLISRHSGKPFDLAIQCGMTHIEILLHEGHIQIRRRQIVLDKRGEFLQKSLVEFAKLHFRKSR